MVNQARADILRDQARMGTASQEEQLLSRASQGLSPIAGDTGAQALTFLIDGGGGVLTVGPKGSLQIPYAATITGWTLLADQSGSVVVDIWKDTYANYPPLVGDTITASAKPTIASDTKGTSTTLTGWITNIVAGDILRFNIDSATTITRVTVVLTLARAA